MDVEKNDSFSVSSTSQSIEKIYSSATLTWKIVLLQRREKDLLRSPIFQLSNKSCELTVFSVILKAWDSKRYINSISLNCLDTNLISTNTFYLCHTSISDEKGKILFEIRDRNDVICICKNCSSHQILHSRSIDIDSVRSLTISLTILSEENTEQALLTSQVIKDEKRDPLLIYDSKLSSDFEELYENRQLSDVTLKLGEEEFPAHKSVLSARSKVFAAMFEHDMKENLQSTVDLVQMEADTLQDMLRYIYCAKVRELSATEALNLYVAADRYDLPELRDICRKVVVTDISINNVCDIAAVADVHNDELLITELKFFISKNGKDIIKTENWRAMSTNNPVLGMKMFEWAFSGQ